ncbi:MAG: DUF3421 domain-containing protein [Leptolyngbyaceae cyanobacterium SM1_4_3]|nr:DUF3421 domain-containing protein [Leptolyngbyaceae cyanobacterium SM1_4_3]
MLSFRKVSPFSALLVLTFVSTVFGAEEALAIEWPRFSNGARGSDPIEAGYVENDTYYVCAGRTPNGYQAGHLGEEQSICYVAWEDSYIRFSRYLVPQGSDEVEWVDRNEADSNQLVRLDPEDGVDTLICRAPNGLPGKVVHGGLRNGICYTSWENYNTTHSNFDVLVRSED